MEAEWERSEPPVRLTLEEARRLLAPALFSVGSIVPLHGGKANSSFLIETDQGPLVLKLHQRDLACDKSLLAPLDVPTPELRCATNEFGLYEWCPGISL